MELLFLEFPEKGQPRKVYLNSRKVLTRNFRDGALTEGAPIGKGVLIEKNETQEGI